MNKMAAVYNESRDAYLAPDDIRCEKVTTTVLVVGGDAGKASVVFDAVMRLTDNNSFAARRAANRFKPQRIILDVRREDVNL